MRGPHINSYHINSYPRIPSFIFVVVMSDHFGDCPWRTLRTLGALLLLKFFHLLAQLVHVRFLEGQRQTPVSCCPYLYVVPFFSQFLLQPQNNIKNHTGSKCEHRIPVASNQTERPTRLSTFEYHASFAEAREHPKAAEASYGTKPWRFGYFSHRAIPRAPRQVFSNK